MATTETMAFLHARGLHVEPKGLSAAMRAAVASANALYYPEPEAEGLTVGEAAVADSGGFGLGDARSDTRDPLVRGIVSYASLLETGLTTAEAAKRIRVSDARIRQRLHERTLLAVREGRAWKLPVFQFTKKGELPGWGEVCRRLPVDVSIVALERWLALPHPDLVLGEEEHSVSPRQWLLEGRAAAAVASLAHELG